MSGINMMEEMEMGFWQIASACWWDFLTAIIAICWLIVIGSFWVSNVIEEWPGLWRWKEWNEIGKSLLCGTAMIPYAQLIWLVYQLWVRK